MAKKNPPSGLFSRSVKLFSMATQVAAKELTDRLKQSDPNTELARRIAQAQIITDQLANLKGAAMKAGQLLSLDTSEFLPPEAVEILSRLQAKAEPTDGEFMYDVLKKELKAERLNKILEFSKAAHASASIGQIHRAEIDNQDVAIKIQYPGVRESIDSDLFILRKVAEGFLSVSGKKFSLDETFSELSVVLHRETNYEIERLNLEKYAALLKDEPTFVVPKTYPDFSTEKILTMSFEQGMTLNDWLKSKPHIEDRKVIASQVLDLFCREFSEWGFVQTDPNFGNFLIQTNPLRLVCLDFGATLTYDLDFRKGYADLLKSLRSKDYKKIIESAISYGLLDPREPLTAREAFITMIQVSMEPFDPAQQPFRFSDPSFEKRSIEANINFSKKLIYSPPPRRLLFLHRKLGGIFNMVKKLGVELTLNAYWERMISPK